LGKFPQHAVPYHSSFAKPKMNDIHGFLQPF
jgi:hypothetical protein